VFIVARVIFKQRNQGAKKGMLRRAATRTRARPRARSEPTPSTCVPPPALALTTTTSTATAAATTNFFSEYSHPWSASNFPTPTPPKGFFINGVFIVAPGAL